MDVKLKDLPYYYVPQNSSLSFIKKTRNQCIENGVQKASKALYRCVCGREKEIEIRNVKSGHTKSCGCIHEAALYKWNQIQKQISTLNNDGVSIRHPLYSCWKSMLDRCYNTRNKQYKNWGLRGVTVCEEWRNSFRSYYDWCIGNGWVKGLQIDKDLKAANAIEFGLIYSPKTCSIVTNKENSNERQNVVKIEYLGQVKTITQWAEYYNLPKGSFHRRIRSMGWPIEKAVSVPFKSRKITR